MAAQIPSTTDDTTAVTAMESPRRYRLRLYTHRDDQFYYVRAAAIGDAFAARGVKVRIHLAEGDSGGIGGQSSGNWARIIATRTIERLLPGAVDEVAFPLSDIPRGSWCFRAQVIDQFGRSCPTDVVQIQQTYRPEWFGSDEGIFRGVPSPWTALEVNDTEVACWGRRYDLGGESVLRQVNALDASLLSGPVEILLNGERITFSPPRWLEKSNDQIVFVRRSESGSLIIDLQGQIEFDGMIRLDWSVRANQPTLVRSLEVRVPMRSDRAKLFYQWRGKYHSGDDKWIGVIPREPMSKSFRPFIWMGNEKCGLSWFAESNAGWYNRDPNRAIEVDPAGDSTMLRLNLVTEPVLVAGGTEPTTDRWPIPVDVLRYTFGFQATPVKPVERDAWDFRAFCLQQHTPGADGELKLSEPLLDKLDRAGVRTIVIFEHWTDIEAHYLTTHKEQIRQIVEACHQRNMQVLLYFGFLVSSLTPEFEAMAEQSIVQPKTGWSLYYYAPQPVQSAWRVCLNSAWQDLPPYGIARVMEELGVDGVYLDGTSHAFACRNLTHGCGVLRPDGSVSPTFPIFAVRSVMKRIYHAVRSRNPDGQINVHNSADMVIPSLAFATSTWDGEQFVGLKSGVSVDTFLPLDTFRTEFMGRPWGVPAELLCYHGKPLTYRQAWVLALLHDVPVRPMITPDGKDLDLCASIWAAMDRFDRRGATWSGYWEEQPTVRVTGSSHVLASAYVHPRNGTLVVVSNLGAELASVAVHVVGDDARDALTGRELSMHNDAIAIEIESLDFILIHTTKKHDAP